MFLLPVSHEDSTIRRVPWVSITVLGICVVVQARACSVEPDLQRRGEQLARSIEATEEQAIEEHLASLSTKEGDHPEDDFADEVEHAASERKALQAMLEPQFAALKKFRAGELTRPDDPRFLRYRALKDEFQAVEQQLPAMRLGYRPALDGLLRMLTSMFAHGGWLHLLGNMWFLYLVGCNLEDRWGRWQFLMFYLVAGCIAALTFKAFHPGLTTPLVGASGAVAGAMGAFMVCFARTKVKIFYLYVLAVVPRWGTFNASAWVVLLVWVVEQFAMTLVEVSTTSTEVAHSAHAGGFLFGAAVAFLLQRAGVDSQLDEASELAAEKSLDGWSEHPLYLQALQLRDQAQEGEAIEKLIELTSLVPDHLAAREELLAIGLRKRNLHAVDLALPKLIDHYQRTRADQPLTALYEELRRALPDYGLTDQELLRVATAASHVKDAPLAIRCVSELMTQHPQSPLQPRAMWLAAQMQAEQGCTALQRDTMQRIVRSYPGHACAKLAREQLGGIGAAG